MKFYGIRRLRFGRLCQRETPLTEDNIVFTSSPIHVRSIKALDEGMIRVGLSINCFKPFISVLLKSVIHEYYHLLVNYNSCHL